MKDEWISQRVAYIRGLKVPSSQQRLLVELAAKPDRTAAEQLAFATVVRAEKAAERVLKIRGDAARLLDAEKKAARKARDHELYQSAGLLIMAGLVDSKTGKPVCDPADLLGALITIAGGDGGIKGLARFREIGRRELQKRKAVTAPSPAPKPGKAS